MVTAETGGARGDATPSASGAPATAGDARSASSPKKTSASRETGDVAARGRARAGELANGAHSVACDAPRVNSLSARLYETCDGVARGGGGGEVNASAKTPPNTRSPSSKDSPTQRTMFSNLWADGGGVGSARRVSRETRNGNH